MRFVFPLLLLLLTALGCSDRERVPVMGHWQGGFYTDKGEAFKGYLQLYRTKDKFKMRLASKDQAAEFEGTWTIEAKRVLLTVRDIKFENPTEDQQKALGMRIITPEEIRAAYAKTITLDLDASETKLKGLTVSMGPLSGYHEFAKGEVTKNTKKALDDLRSR